MKLQALKQAKLGRPVDPERVEAKRLTILRAAADRFGRNGYNETDVNEVAAAAGITKGTVYYYFGSKENLFLSTVDYEAGRLRKRVLSAADACDDPLDELAAVVYSYLQFFVKNPHVVELFVEERAIFKNRKKHSYFVHRDMTLSRWHECVKLLIVQGRVRATDPERFVNVLSDTLYGTIFTNYFTGTDVTPEVQAEWVLEFLFNGVLTEPCSFRFESNCAVNSQANRKNATK